MHARLRGSNNVLNRLTLNIRSPFLGNKIVESRPDMNIKVAAYMHWPSRLIMENVWESPFYIGHTLEF